MNTDVSVVENSETHGENDQLSSNEGSEVSAQSVPSVVQRKHEELWEKIYESLDTAEDALPEESKAQVQALLSRSAEPAEMKARMINMQWFTQQYGDKIPAETLETNWPAYKVSFAKAALGLDKREISDVEFYGALGGKFREHKAAKDSYAAAKSAVFQAQIADEFGAADFDKSVFELLKPNSPEQRDKFVAGVLEYSSELRGKLELLRPLAGMIVQQARPKSAGSGELIEMVSALSKEDRQLVYAFAAARAGTKDKNFAEQSWDSITRGAADLVLWNKDFFYDAPNMSGAEKYLEIADKIAVPVDFQNAKRTKFFGGSEPYENIFEALKTNMMLSREDIASSGIKAWRKSGEQGKDWHCLTEEEKAELAGVVEKMKSRRTVEAELRQLADSTLDPIKGDNFFTEKIWYPALNTTPYMLQSLVPYVGVPMLISSTSGMRTAEFEARGLSTSDAANLAAISAVPEAGIEFLEGKLLVGKIPVLGQALDRLKATTTKRLAAKIGVNLAGQVVGQNLQEAAQDITPLLIQDVAAQFDGAIPGVAWDKEFKPYLDERVDTFWALLPMTLIGTGVAGARDTRYLRDVTALKGCGFSEAAAASIRDATDAHGLEAGAALVQKFKADPAMFDANSAGAKAARAEMTAALDAQNEKAVAGARIEKTDTGYSVRDAAGKLVADGLQSPEVAWSIKEATDAGTAKMQARQAKTPAQERAAALFEADGVHGLPENFDNNRLGITPRDRDMSPGQRQVEARFADELNSRSDAENDALYDALPESQGGRVLSMDTAREMSEDYVRDARGHTASSEAPAARYIRDRYLRELKKPAEETPIVRFTAGGPGSGKSMAVGDAGNQIVYDSTLSNPALAKSNIDAALKSGRSVQIVYVHRPIEKAVEGASLREKKTGRHVTDERLGLIHYRSQSTFLELAEHYKDSREVKFRVIDNGGELGTVREVANGVDFLNQEGIRYANEHDAASRATQAGRDTEINGRKGERDNSQHGGGFEEKRGPGYGGDASQRHHQVDSDGTLGSPLGTRGANPAKTVFETPINARPGAGVSAPKVIAAMSDVVKIAGGSGEIRVGKLKLKKTAGEYWVREKISRIRTASDVPTAIHELGHALHDALWQGNYPEFPEGCRRNLEKLGRDLYGDKVPFGGYASEGFAEFFRLEMCDPEKAKTAAPAMSAWWNETFLPENKQLAGAIAKAQERATTWFRQGSLERARQSIEQPKTVSEKLAAFKHNASLEFRRKWIEAASSLEDFVSEAEKKSGKKIIDAENPFATLTARRKTADGKAHYMATAGMIDFYGNVVGPSLQEVFAGLDARKGDFLLYLWARRSIALWDDPRGARNPGLDRNDAVQILSELDSPDFAVRAQKVYDWNAGVLNYAKQASPAYEKVVNKIREVDPGSYIPLFRVFDEIDASYKKLGGLGGVKGKDLTKRLAGSGRGIKSPVESMIAQAKEIVAKADNMHILDQAITLAEKVPGLGHWISEVPRDQVPGLTIDAAKLVERLEKIAKEHGGSMTIDPGTADLESELVTFFSKAIVPADSDYCYIPAVRDGKILWYEVDKGLHETLGAMNASVSGKMFETLGIPLVGQALRVQAQTLRMGTTALRASFSLVTNPVRDLRTLYYNTRAGKNGAVIFGNWIGSMFSLAANGLSGGRFAKDSVFIRYKDAFDRLGLEMSGSLTQDAAPLKIASRRVERGGKWNPREWRDYYDILLHFFQFSESASRVAELKMVAERMGWSPDMPLTAKQAATLANAAKQVTTDFTRAGTLAREWNAYVPFFNASIQGKKAAYDAFKRNPPRWLFTRGLVLATLAAANWWRNKDEEWWREMSDGERFSHDYIRIGGEIIRLPRAFDVDTLFAGGTTAILDAWHAEEPERVANWFKSAFEEFTVVASPDAGNAFINFNSLPPWLKEGMQQLRNRDEFRQAPIVPRSEENRPEAEQYSWNNTRVAIEVGKILDVSPRRIDHFIRGIFGGVGGDLAALTGRGDEFVGTPPLIGEQPADVPVFGVLMRRDGTAPTNSVSVNKLYDAYGKMIERQYSVREEETNLERLERIATGDAIAALQAIAGVRSLTTNREERKALSSLQAEIAREALEAIEDGSIARQRGKFKSAGAKKENELRRLKKEAGRK